MSAELRLKLLKKGWEEIQQLREEQHEARALWRKYGKIVRQKGQDIGKALDEYNKSMV